MRDSFLLICDLSAHSQRHLAVIHNAVDRVVGRGWYVLGPEVTAFESAFAGYVGVDECRTVANGTDALELALAASGVVCGDGVATVANAGMYTSTAVLALGATPAYMDVDGSSMLVGLANVERAIANGVRAVVVTHLYGRAVPEIEAIADTCRRSKVALIEDCAQAHGAMVGGRRVGSFGDCGCFSFYPTKNLGALGDGGAVVSRDLVLAQRVSALRQYGWSAKYMVAVAGARNSRLDEMQAAILTDFLPFLDQWNTRRRAIATSYSSHIAHPLVTAPAVGAEDYVAHLYVVRSSLRDSLREHLRSASIASDIHYPIPDHRQPVFAERFGTILLPVTEKLSQDVLTLPCYPEMSDDDVHNVIEAVNEWQP